MDRRDLYEDYDYIDCYLYESNHFSEIFEECIDDIALNINEFGLMKYSGWCYNNKSYSMNKNNIGKKIYIWYLYEDSLDDGKVLTSSNEAIYILVNEKKNKNISDIKATLLHEFVHMIKIYSSDILNNLDNKKELISNIKNEFISEFNIIKYMPQIRSLRYLISRISYVLYICGLNEQLASINTAIKYIDTLTYDDIKSMVKSLYEQELTDNFSMNHGPKSFSKLALIFNILKEIDNTHFLTLFTSVIDNFYIYFPIVLLIISYYLNKHNLIKLRYITYDYIINYLHNKGNIPLDDNILKEIDRSYKYLFSVYTSYKKKLYNATYAIMNKKKIFLTPDDVVNISEHTEYKFYYKHYILD